MSEDPALDVDSTNLYAFVGWGPQESTDPTGEVALIDNAIGGVVSVAIGWGSSKLCEHFAKTDEDKASCAYSWKDATIDFGLGFATSGLSSINKVAKLGKVGRFVIRGVAEMTLDTGLEAARKEWKGEDYDLGTLAQGAARNFAIGEAGSQIGRKLVGKFRKAIDAGLSSGAPRGGLASSPVNRGVGSGGPFGWVADKYRGMRLGQIHRRAAREVDAAIEVGSRSALEDLGASSRQAYRALRPRSQARFRGTIIDQLVKARASRTFGLKGLRASGPFEYGADFWNKKTMRAWDMTTPGQWSAHVDKYITTPGTGRPVWRILYPLLH